MAEAARAIIIHDNQLLVMHRDKHGSQYFTLVGGRLNNGETPEQAVVREVKEETGLEVTSSKLVFTEDHAEPYNKQYIFLCEVKSFDSVGISETSEEGFMNKMGANMHRPSWVAAGTLPNIQFRTPQLQKALVDGLNNGFPDDQSVKL